MHTRNETDTLIRARIARLINEIENLKIDLEETAGDLSDNKQRSDLEDFCYSVDNAITDVVHAFGYNFTFEMFSDES